MLINKKEKMLSIAKAIIALFNLINNKDTKLALLITKYNLEILIPRTYKEAINNPNYN